MTYTIKIKTGEGNLIKYSTNLDFEFKKKEQHFEIFQSFLHVWLCIINKEIYTFIKLQYFI